jgi:hypothetical protein
LNFKMHVGSYGNKGDGRGYANKGRDHKKYETAALQSSN